MAALFNIIAFLLPIDRSNVFWTAYVFEMVAIILQFPVFKLAFDKAETTHSKFLGLPVFQVGLVYLIIQTIISLTLFMLDKHSLIPSWAAIIICAVILASALVCGITTDIARESVVHIEATQKKNSSRMKELRLFVGELTAKTTDTKLNAALSALTEDFRYSDPISSNETEIVEEELLSMLHTLSDKIDANSASIDDVNNIKHKLEQRNQIAISSK